MMLCGASVRCPWIVGTLESKCPRLTLLTMLLTTAAGAGGGGGSRGGKCERRVAKDRYEGGKGEKYLGRLSRE